MPSSTGSSTQRAVAAGSISGTVAFLWSHIIWPWVFPVGAPFVTVFLAWAQGGIPWMYIWVGALLAFASATVAVVFFEAWSQSRRVADKFVVDFSRPGIDAAEKDGKRTITAVQMMVSLTNKAKFPISYVVDQIDTKVVDHPTVYTQGALDNYDGIVGGEASHGYRDKAVTIPGGIDAERFNVLLHVIVRYGRKGNEKFRSDKKFKAEFVNKPGSPAIDVFVFPDIARGGSATP